MSTGDVVFRQIQAIARSTATKGGTGAPTQEYLIRHTLESFLDRLTRTSHAGDFVLKGGVLLAAYGARRPTKDADANAVSADVTAEPLTQVVRDIAAIDIDDGVVFDLDTINVQEIREQADYPACVYGSPYRSDRGRAPRPGMCPPEIRSCRLPGR